MVLGILVRLVTAVGSLLLALAWAKSLSGMTPMRTGGYLVYIVLLWIIFFGYPHQVLSIGAWWRRNVARWRWLW